MALAHSVLPILIRGGLLLPVIDLMCIAVPQIVRRERRSFLRRMDGRGPPQGWSGEARVETRLGDAGLGVRLTVHLETR